MRRLIDDTILEAVECQLGKTSYSRKTDRRNTGVVWIGKARCASVTFDLSNEQLEQKTLT